MNEMVKSHSSRKNILATLASLLACFALVMALVPVQAIAAEGDASTGDNTEATNPTTPGEGEGGSGTEGGGTDNPDEPTAHDPLDVPDAAEGLIYTGEAQKLLDVNEGYEIVIPDPDEPATPDTPDTPDNPDQGQDPENPDQGGEGDDPATSQAAEDETEPEPETGLEVTKDGVMATDAGTYKFTVKLKDGYTWKGGGTTDQNYEVTIAQADINKATTATVSNVTFMGEPVKPEVTITMANGTKLVEDTDYTLEYVDNDQVGTATVIIKGAGNFMGTKVAQFQIGEHQAMYRVYNPNSGEHFYTASTVERDHLIEVGWKNEDIGWYAPEKSNAPVFRLYNPNAGEHHFTMSAVERDALVKEGWNDEGIGWYSDEAQTVKVLRQYNPNAYANNHNYTTSQYEFDHNISLGWQDEGIAWYAAAEGGADESDK